METEEQEALSRAHDPVALTVRYLASGRYAVYDQWCRLLRYSDIYNLHVTLVDCFKSHNFNEIPRYAAPQTTKQRDVDAVLKELGL